jgi:hypothetical protein
VDGYGGLCVEVGGCPGVVRGNVVEAEELVGGGDVEEGWPTELVEEGDGRSRPWEKGC